MNQAPVVTRLAASPSFPSIHDLALFTKGFLVKDGRSVLQQIVCCCKPVISRKQSLGPGTGGTEIDVAIFKRGFRCDILAGGDLGQVKVCDTGDGHRVGKTFHRIHRVSRSSLWLLLALYHSHGLPVPYIVGPPLRPFVSLEHSAQAPLRVEWP